MHLPISKNTIVKGLRIFAVLTILGLVLIFYLTGTRETIEVLRQLRMTYILIAGSLVVLDLILGAGRIFIFIRKISELPSSHLYIAGFKGNLSNIFMGAKKSRTLL